MTSSRQVRRIYPELFLPPVPHTFCRLVTGLRVNFEVLSYSDQGISFAVEWVAGFVWARAWAVNIEEIDVSNGPESGRNLAEISISRHGCFVRSVVLTGFQS